MVDFVLVGVGGFLGSVARYGVTLAVRSQISHPFPFQTLLVNFTGCLAVGFLFEFLRNHSMSSSAMLFLTVGFLGAFTTFSAFGIETIQLMKSDSHALAMINVVANLVLSLFATILGVWIGSANT